MTRLVELGEVCLVASGQAAPQDRDAFSDSGIPFVRAGSLERLSNGEDEQDLELIPEENARSYRLRLFPPGTVLFAKSGMSAKLDRIHVIKRACYVVSHLAALVPGKDLDSGYLRRWLERHPPSRLIPNDAYPSIRLSVISGLKITLPPLPKQKRIAAILDKADEIQSKRIRAIQLADQFLRSVFLDMFGDPAVNPKKWPTSSLDSFGMVVTGKTPSRKTPDYYGGQLEWIKSDNINTPYHFLTRAQETLSELGRGVARVTPSGSVLVTCIAGSPDCIGNAAIADREVAFNQQINAIVPDIETDTHFLYAQLLVGKRLVQRASTESMKGLVSKSRFANVKMIKPPKHLRAAFGVVFGKYQEVLDKLYTAHSQSAALFASLSQRAFRGEL